MQRLVAAVAALAAARKLEDVTRIVRGAARELTRADGVTFVLREGTDCFYADEEAIAPLWKGKRFPIETCISGWAMLNNQPVAIEDVYADPRIPRDAYQPTFVKSLLMVPVGEHEAIAAIGAYWAQQHRATEDETQILQALAQAANLALDNVYLNARLEQTLEREREARRIAESAAKTKDEFLATLSHELRTPLHVIQNWVWQLKRTPEGERTFKKALEIIERNTELQARLIEDLLDVSESVRGRLRVNAELVDLGRVCERVVEVCELAARAKKLRLELHKQSTEYVWGDPDRLQQILWNVLSNAIKFTPENGRVQLRISRAARHARVTVEDTGIGIDAEFLPHMFERFTQADSTSTRSFGGLGLGLAVVKELVNLHGGNVSAASRGRYQGTTVTIEFPIPALMDQPAAWLGAGRAMSDHARLSGATVLVVDDDDETLTSVENVLRHHGAQVLRASSTEQALSLLERHRPAVIVADLAMPHRDGIDLIKAIRQLESPTRTVPAAALSAYVAREQGAMASAAGFQLYIEKPVRPEVFVGQIATLAGIH